MRELPEDISGRLDLLRHSQMTSYCITALDGEFSRRCGVTRSVVPLRHLSRPLRVGRFIDLLFRSDTDAGTVSRIVSLSLFSRARKQWDRHDRNPAELTFSNPLDAHRGYAEAAGSGRWRGFLSLFQHSECKS